MKLIKKHWRTARRSILPFKWEQQYVAWLHYKYYQKLRVHSGTHSLQPFDAHQCIFIHVPKNGGMAVSNALFGKNRMLGGHYAADFYKVVFGEDFKKFTKFAISRNPWDRLVSAYHYLKGGGMNYQDKEWEQKHISEYSTFADFVNGWLDEKNIYKGMHFTPQYEFVSDGKGNLLVDYLGRFEAMQDSFDHIKQLLALDEKVLSHSNKSVRKSDYRIYYGDKEVERVAEVYKKDIKLFGYSFDGK